MRRGGRIAVMALLALLAGVFAAPLSAEESGGTVAAPPAGDEPIDLVELEKRRRNAMFTMPMSQRVGRYMKATAEEMDEGNFTEARRLLLKLNMKRLNRFERAMVYRMIGYISYAIGDSDAAIEAFENALAEEALVLSVDVSIMFNVVQLRAAREEWPQALAALDRWRRYVPEATGLSLYLRAVAHYQLDDYDAALAAMQECVATTDEPEEAWLQLLAALYMLQEDFASVTPVLEELVMRFPKKQYWVQLSLIYGARDDYRHSLAVQQIAHLQGFLTEDRELQRLARSYAFAGLPFEAANVLDEGLGGESIEGDAKAYEFLANSWIQAREYDRSVPPLRRAAELSENGDLYVRLGQVQMAQEQWKEAVSLFEKAIEKGDLRNPGSAELLLGIALYNDDRVGPARFKFERAKNFEKTRKAANDWLTHIDREARSG